MKSLSKKSIGLFDFLAHLLLTFENYISKIHIGSCFSFSYSLTYLEPLYQPKGVSGNAEKRVVEEKKNTKTQCHKTS